MIIQKSYKNENSTLYIIPTPIGNLDDLTLRTVKVLSNEIDVLFCEDTRTSLKIINHLDLTIPLKSYHEHNREKGDFQILKLLEESKTVGLVSDAGMPGISDPGFSIVGLAKEKGYNVVVLPGATAFVLPVVYSVFASFKFTYYGFLDKNQSKKKRQLTDIIDTKTPTVLYESPHQLLKTLALLVELDQEIEVCVARELSKLNEEYVSGTALEILTHFSENKIRGEFVIVIGTTSIVEKPIDPITHVKDLINQGLKKNDAIKQVAKINQVSKNEIYQLFINEEE